MAKFHFDFPSTYSHIGAETDTVSPDELFNEVLLPAALKLKEYFREAIESRFKRRTGSLADSIDYEEEFIGKDYVSVHVKPFGRHKRGKYTRKSRAGDPNAKGAKHDRKPTTKALKNEELAYLLEYGTPRIPASHWMEETNEQVGEEIQDTVESGFTDLLKKKGLI